MEIGSRDTYSRCVGGGKAFRLQRIFRRQDGRAFIVPMDHSFTQGPLGAAARTDELVGMLTRHGADAVVLHKGRVGLIEPRWLSRLGLIVHLSGGTARSVEPNTKVLVSGVEEALSLGADAVSVHVNIGSSTEARQLADVGAVAAECSKLGVPLLAMMYARDSDSGEDTSPSALAHLASIAVDLGADVVKLAWSGSSESMREVVLTSPVPVVVAGGPVADRADVIFHAVAAAMASSASGVAIGRNVFNAADPAAVIRRISQIVHAPCGALAGPPVDQSARTSFTSTEVSV